MIHFSFNIGFSKSKVIFKRRKKANMSNKNALQGAKFGTSCISLRTPARNKQTQEARLEPAIRDAQNLAQNVFPPWNQARISRREDSYFFLLYVVYFCFPCPIWLLNVDWKAYVAIFRSADEKKEKKEYSTRTEVGFNGRSIRAELFRRREKSRGNRGFVSV